MAGLIPSRVWLLVAIAAAAFAPASCVFDHLSRRDDRRGYSPDDLTWHTTGSIAPSLLFLAGLLALAVFIFTPTAERLASAPQLWPLVLLALGGWAIVSAINGVRTGTIAPMVRGLHKHYRRSEQPKRFWASVLWNGALGCFMMVPVVSTLQQVRLERCANRDDALPPSEQLAACADRIAGWRGTHDRRYAGLLVSRGVARHRLGDLHGAEADYRAALSNAPSDSGLHYDLALVALGRRDGNAGLAELDEAIRLDPGNAAARDLRTDLLAAIDEARSAAQPTR